MQVFSLQLGRPLRHETLVMFVDTDGCGISLVTVSDTVEPHQVVDVAETLAMAVSGQSEVRGLVVVSVRPGGGVLPDDDVLWFEAAAAVNLQDKVLIDWLVVGRAGTRSMTEELGVPSRWPSRT